MVRLMAPSFKSRASVVLMLPAVLLPPREATAATAEFGEKHQSTASQIASSLLP